MNPGVDSASNRNECQEYFLSVLDKRVLALKLSPGQVVNINCTLYHWTALGIIEPIGYHWTALGTTGLN